jgi:hypothetical protein
MQQRPLRSLDRLDALDRLLALLRGRQAEPAQGVPDRSQQVWALFHQFSYFVAAWATLAQKLLSLSVTLSFTVQVRHDLDFLGEYFSKSLF